MLVFFKVKTRIGDGQDIKASNVQATMSEKLKHFSYTLLCCGAFGNLMGAFTKVILVLSYQRVNSAAWQTTLGLGIAEKSLDPLEVYFLKRKFSIEHVFS